MEGRRSLLREEAGGELTSEEKEELASEGLGVLGGT